MSDGAHARPAQASAEIAAYRAATAYLNEGLIRLAVPDPSRRTAHGPRLNRRLRMLRFLPRLGHPERAFAAAHIGGTSGKGSTATMLAELLRAHGVRTGLHVTPYLQVSTEKLWVDGHYASGAQLASLIDWVRPHAEACRGADVPMHGMASVAITLEHFRRERVEVGVMEVGVGGRCDITNVLDTRVAVVGPVGLDHIKTLGPTLADIAWHKAGIIHAGCRAVVLEGPGLDAARARAREVGASLRVVPTEVPALRVDPDDGCARFDYRGERAELRGVRVAMPGSFQAQNATLALAALEALDVTPDPDAVRAALADARLPGRGELVPPERTGGCAVMLDGAHNADKIDALARSLPSGARFHLVAGVLAGRQQIDALRRLARDAATIVTTEPRVYAKTPRSAAELAAELDSPHAVAEADPRRALDRALDAAAPDDLVVVTGSLYLVGNLRARFYPDERVLLERTSFPSLG